jgi:hypothetical protein
MTKSKRLNRHRVVFDMHIDLYKILKEVCEDRGMTVTMYITRTLASRLKKDSIEKIIEVNG